MLCQILERGGYEPLPKPRWWGLDLWKVRIPPVAVVGGFRILPDAGFVTDLATIPWWARWRIDPAGRNGPPAVIHDWLLELARRGEIDWPKWQIDLVLFALLKASGSPDLEATLMFLAVRTRPRPPARA